MPAVLAFLIGQLPKVSGRLRKYSRFREPRTETSFDRDCRQPVWLNMLWEARLTLISGSQVRSLSCPPPSPAEPGIFPSGSSRPFVPGFPLSVLRRFTLCGSSLSLSAISGARSPHPKIPFLADKALAGGCGCVERSHSRRIHDGRFAGVRYC